MNDERLLDVERWIAWVRLAAVLFAALEVGVFTERFPSGYERLAWALTAVFALGAVLLFVASRPGRRASPLLGAVALAFDTAVISGFALLFSYEYGSPTRWALIFPVVEAALRFGLRGGVIVPLFLLPTLAFLEWWRADRFGPPGFSWDRVTFPFGILLLTGLIVGWLVARLRQEAAAATGQAAEAEQLRDRLGRRVDLLEAAGRCARALGSSLDIDEAFGAFIRELRGLVPFDRTAIVLAEGGVAHVMATAGAASTDVFPPGSHRPIAGSLLEHVLRGETIYREDMRETRFYEEGELVRLGLHCRVVAPLLAGARAIGMISVVREEPRSFTQEEVELLSLLGRFVATAVENIRAYDAERTTVEELRRLSALRADFVSLVSHELRSPMATVIGSARTLQQRWRELKPAQRESFLALIADETNRLATLVADVLDTSRIEAGTFSYTFADVDLAELLRDVVAAAEIGQDEVPLATSIADPVPPIRGDRERLRQVLANLVENAVKYSPSGELVEVSASALNGNVVVKVRDRGPGIASDDQSLIFEKFGRARSGKVLPGTGLGLFIARSIAEAHGGTLDVRSAPSEGATFTLVLTDRRLGADAHARDAELLRQLFGAAGDHGPQLGRLEHDGLAALTEHLADEPLFAADPHLAERAAVAQQHRAALDHPARDHGRVEDPREPRVAELVRVEALTPLEALLRQLGRAHPVEAEAAFRVARAIPRVHEPVRQRAFEDVGLDDVASSTSPRPPSGTRSRRGAARGSPGSAS